MALEVSRQRLYELVWLHPRTTLAKELEVSDVAIRKHCVKNHVPVPPAGYWARLAHGKTAERPALPIRLPGHSDRIEIGQSSNPYWPLDRQKILEQIPEPPLILEDVDRQVAEAMKLAGRIKAFGDLSNPHPGIRRLLASEQERREAMAKNRWAFKKPRFEATHHQRQLRLFNSLAHALGKVFPRIEIYAQDQWVQGYGTQHFLNMRIGSGSINMTLEFREPGDIRAERGKSVTATTLSVESGSSDSGTQTWGDQPRSKLERQLEDIVKALFYRAEQRYRAHVQWVYENQVDRRNQVLAEIDAERLEQERKRLEVIAKRKEQLRQDILRLSNDRRVAREIREMVAELEGHPDLTSKDRKLFDEWIHQALELANQLDPMKRSIADLLASVREPAPPSAS